MSTKKHPDHPHLTGEHRHGDTGQLILFFLFMAVYITDTFFFQYSTFLDQRVSAQIQVPIAAIIWVTGAILASGGMRSVFGRKRSKTGVISTGVFRVVRHPIYLGAILFYLGAVIISLSIASALLLFIIVAFYIAISRYEERILTEAFGEEYTRYKAKTGMLFPRFGKKGENTSQ